MKARLADSSSHPAHLVEGAFPAAAAGAEVGVAGALVVRIISLVAAGVEVGVAGGLTAATGAAVVVAAIRRVVTAILLVGTLRMQQKQLDVNRLW